MSRLFPALFFWAFCAIKVQAEPARLIRFPEASPKQIKEAHEILEAVTRCFQKSLGVTASHTPVEIVFVKSLTPTDRSALFFGRVEGKTYFQKELCRIEIAQNRRGSWGRVFAHEAGHLLIQETFGEPRNLFLNEGFAEFLAGDYFPSEVRQSRENARQHVQPWQSMAYIEGGVFCDSQAFKPEFASFFSQEIGRETGSMDELKIRWKAYLERLRQAQSGGKQS